MLEEFLPSEIEKNWSLMSGTDRYLATLAREVAKQSKQTKDTLASITAMYVKTFGELKALREELERRT